MVSCCCVIGQYGFLKFVKIVDSETLDCKPKIIYLDFYSLHDCFFVHLCYSSTVFFVKSVLFCASLLLQYGVLCKVKYSYLLANVSTSAPVAKLKAFSGILVIQSIA